MVAKLTIQIQVLKIQLWMIYHIWKVKILLLVDRVIVVHL